MNRPTMLTRPGALAALMALSLAAGGCENPKKPFRDAKAAFGQDLDGVAAFAPVIKAWSPKHTGAGLLSRMAADAAMEHVVTIGGHGRGVEPEKGEIDSPRLQIAAALRSLVQPCTVPTKRPGDVGGVTDERKEEARRLCIEALDKMDVVVAKLDKLAVAVGMPAGTIPRIDPSAYPEGDRPMAALGIVRPTEAEKAYSTLVADPKATFEVLDAACQKAADSRRDVKPTGDPEANHLSQLGEDLARSECARLRGMETNKATLMKCGDPSPPPFCTEPKRCESVEQAEDVPAIHADLVAKMRAACKR